MRTPLPISCPTAADIPPAYQLRAWAAADRPVVLRLPPAAFAGRRSKAAVVARLAGALPGFEVTDGGGDPTHELVTVARPPQTD